MLLKDYSADLSYIENVVESKQKELDGIISESNEILQGLEKQIVGHKLYKSHNRITELLKETERIRNIAKASLVHTLTGSRWVGKDKIVIGPYGVIKTLSKNEILALVGDLGSITKSHFLQNIGNKVYIGRHIKEGNIDLGSIIIPIPDTLDSFEESFYKFNLLGLKLSTSAKNEKLWVEARHDIHFLEYLRKKSFSIFIILMTAMLLSAIVIFTIHKNKRKLSDLITMKDLYKDSFKSLQEINQAFLNKNYRALQQTKKLSQYLLDARRGSHSGVLTEETETELIEKIYLTSSLFNENGEPSLEAKEFDIIPILRHCIKAQIDKITSNGTKVHFEATLPMIIVFGEETQLYSLFFKVLSLTLLRIPEGGFLNIKVKRNPRKKDEIVSISFEDNGFLFKVRIPLKIAIDSAPKLPEITV